MTDNNQSGKFTSFISGIQTHVEVTLKWI